MSSIAINNETVSRKRIGAFEKRVHEVDFLRGVLIILVLLDHILNNFFIHSKTWYEITGVEFWNNVYQVTRWYWYSIPRQEIRQICLTLFCLISGISCAFSKNNWKRAGLMIVVFAVLQVAGNLLNSWHILGDTNTIIDFNVIGVLAFSTLFYCFVEKWGWKGLTASMLAWLLFSSYGMDIIRTIPGSLEARVPSLIEPTFDVGDWMPLVPYITFFFIGAIISLFFYQDRKPRFKRHEWERPFCFVGRHTIWIYLGHQVVFIPIFLGITAIVRVCYGA